MDVFFWFIAVLFVSQLISFLLCSKKKKRNFKAMSSELSSELQRRNAKLLKTETAETVLTAIAPSENDPSPSGFAMSEHVRKHKRVDPSPSRKFKKPKRTKDMPNTVDEDWALGLSKPAPAQIPQPSPATTKPAPRIDVRRPKLNYESNRREPDPSQPKNQKPRWEQSLLFRIVYVS